MGQRKKRAASIAFRQLDASVSRTAILHYDRIIEIYKANIDEAVVATATTTVANVCTACRERAPNLTLRVIEKPTDGSDGKIPDPSHAEIRARHLDDPQKQVKLTRDASQAILNSCQIRMVE